MRDHLVEEHQQEHHHQGHHEIDHHARDIAEREDQPGKVDLADQLRVSYETAADLGEGAAEQIPAQHAGVAEEEVGGVAGGFQSGHGAEDKAEDPGRHQRLEHDPDHPEGGLFVTQFQIAGRQLEQQVAILPKVVQVEVYPAFFGFDRQVRFRFRQSVRDR